MSILGLLAAMGGTLAGIWILGAMAVGWLFAWGTIFEPLLADWLATAPVHSPPAR